MNTSKVPPLTEEERSQGRRWLENWRIAGDILESERAARLAQLSDVDAARIALDLWRFARPSGGDDAEGLILFKQVIHSNRRQ